MKLSTRLTLAMMALVLLTTVAIGLYANRNVEAVVEERALGAIETHTRLLATELESYVRSARGDVLSFRSAAALHGIAAAQKNGGVHPTDGSSEQAWRTRMATRFAAELSAKPSYLQFRIIGAADGGREVVRVERVGINQTIRIVPDHELQRKGDRAYFQETMGLRDGQVYVSPIDLNQERLDTGTPAVPVMRIATPVQLPDGSRFGIIVINVDMWPAFERIRQAARRGSQLYVVNEQGDFLVHPDRSREFRFATATPYRLNDAFIGLSEAVNSDVPSIRIAEKRDGERAGVGVFPLRLADQLKLAVIEAMPLAEVMAPAIAVRDSTLLAGAAAMLAAILLAFLLARTLARPLVQVTGAIEGFSHDAPLTIPPAVLAAPGEIGLLARAFADMAAKRGQVEASLRNTLARLEAIFDSSIDAVFTLNESGSIESINAAAEKLFDYSPGAVARRDIGRLIDFDSKEGVASADFLRKLVATDRATGEFVGRARDGSGFPIELVAAEMQISDRRMFVLFARDITERKRNDRMKDEFVATVSHELRTPLTSISGSLGLLTGGAASPLPEAAMRLLRIAHGNSQRLVRLINDILDIEKIESGRVEFSFEKVELRLLLEQAVDANRGYAQSYGVDLKVDPVSAEVAVRGDRDRLIQVFTNLLSNGIKFTARGTGVVVAVQCCDGRARVSVRDHGPGISDSFRARIFEKFAQADATDSREKGGTGLGLSIVKQIILRHDGEVSFEPAEGGGSVFHVSLPIYDDAEAEPAQPELADADERLVQALHGRTPDSGAVRPRVLHVDDDHDVLFLVAQSLGSVADVVSVESLVDARRALAAHRFDLAVLDVALAEGSGLDLLPDLCSANGDEIPIVVLSAQDSPELAARAVAMLSKSRGAIDNLVATLRRLVEGGNRRSVPEAAPEREKEVA